MKTLTKPSAIFWDWDGTLVDSFDFLLETHNYIRRTIGKNEISEDKFKGYFGSPRNALYEKVYGADCVERAICLFEEYFTKNHLNGSLRLIDNSNEVLSCVFNLGIPMGVVSNRVRKFLIVEAEHFGWSDYFKTFVGAGDTENGKPSAQPLFLALEKINLRPSKDVWLVGDTLNDVVCAKDADCTSIFIGENPDSGADFSYADLSLFKKAVLEIS